MKDLILVAALLLCCVSGAIGAFHCYGCTDSLPHQLFNAPLALQLYRNVSVVTAGVYLPPCKDFDEDEDRFKFVCKAGWSGCAKLVAVDTDGKSYVTRGCSHDELDDSCKDIDDPSYKSGTLCTCDSEYCNSASGATPLFYLLVMGLALLTAAVKQ